MQYTLTGNLRGWYLIIKQDTVPIASIPDWSGSWTVAVWIKTSDVIR